MKSSFAWVAVTSVVGVGLVIGASNLACQSDEEYVDYGKAGGGGSPASDASTGGGGSTGVAGAGGVDTSACDLSPGQQTTIKDIATQVIGPKNGVKFTGIAMSPAILAYTSKSKGTCLWAVFLKDPAEDYGTMVISYGENATTTSGDVGQCPPVSTSGLFGEEAIQPGDVFEVLGTTGSYVPASCTDGGMAPASQVQVEIKAATKSCAMKRISKSTGAPLPKTITDYAGIMQGKAEYQSMYVKIENVDAEDWPGGGSTDEFGAIRLKGTGLEIHDKFYYKATKAPQFGSAQHFNSIQGLVHLDYCSWVIQPLNKCTDYDPPSLNCTDGGT